MIYYAAIEYDLEGLDVCGSYIPSEKATLYEPGCSSAFEIHNIMDYIGSDVTGNFTAEQLEEIADLVIAEIESPKLDDYFDDID